MTVVEDQQPGRVAEPFPAFYVRERRAVVGLAYALSGSRLAAEVLAQEAFVAACRRWDEIVGYDRLAVRRPARPAELPGEAEELWSLVRRLPKRQAQAVALYYVDMMTVAEIAAVLEITADSVYTHLRRARARLTKEMTQP